MAVTTAFGRPLVAEQRSYVGHVRGGIGSYTAQSRVTDAQRSLGIGRHGRLITIAGIGSVSASCSSRPVARFRLTAWAQGEGPPKVTHTVAATSHVTSLAGLAERYVVPAAETARQAMDEWEISDGGGEAFQFSASVTALVTVTTTRCDLLAEATDVTTGVFYRYAQ